MAPPKKRLVITKDKIKTERIPRQTHKETILGKTGKKSKVLKFLKNRSLRKSKKRHVTPWKPKNSSFKFRQLHTIVKNSRTQMKLWSKVQNRRRNFKYQRDLDKQLNGISILLIVRIHRNHNLHPNIKSILSSLGLQENFSCVIVRNTPKVREKLRDVLAFVTFGVPSKGLVRDLLMKRGKIYHPNMKSRSLIKSNVIIEECLGKHDIICVEDVVDILSNSSSLIKSEDNNIEHTDDEQKDGNEKLSAIKKFDMVSKSINPFVLNPIKIPKYGLQGPFDHKGYWGYRGEHINVFVEKLI